MELAKPVSLSQLSSRSRTSWRIVQVGVWLVGAAILVALLVFPDVGIQMFWNVLIPLAPAILVVAVGLWRNICPLATTALSSRHFLNYQRKILTTKQIGILNVVAVLALYLIVPLRHVFFNNSGIATGLFLVAAGTLALVMGLVFEWKSGWCSGLCPVHPVEKLYGISNRLSLPNAHCHQCHQCVKPCPDSVSANKTFSFSGKTSQQKFVWFLMAAAFPGFIWGWFQVPDSRGVESVFHLLAVYAYPFGGALVSAILFLGLKLFLDEVLLIRIFSASAVSCYYWFRLPALIGYGLFTEDGMLVDLTSLIPEWASFGMVVSLSLFFFWWIVFRKQHTVTWTVRPVMVKQASAPVTDKL